MARQQTSLSTTPDTIMDSQKFLGIFSEVLAPDTARVKAATATLRADFYPLPQSLTVLLQLLLSDQPLPERQLAATEARKLVPKHWKKLPAQEKEQYRQRLLQGALEEEEQVVRHATAQVITAVIKIDLESGQWLDIFDILLRAAGSNVVRQRQVGTYLLFTSLESIGEAMEHRFPEMLAIFSKTIQDNESAEVRINTMLALSRLAMVLDTEKEDQSLKLLQDAIPQMVAVLEGAIKTGDADRTAQSFEVFQTLLGCDSAVLNKHFKALVDFMMKVASEKALDEDARTQALSFLMQCIRYRKLKMQGLKVGEQMTKMCLEISTELGESQAEEEDVTTPRSALGLLDEMASSLPPSQVVVPLLHSLGPYVNSNDPDRRQGGIMALGMIVEGAPDFVATQLHEIIPLILKLLGDPELKVRSAALDGVMRVAEELPEELGKEHEKLLPALVSHMEMAMRNASGPDDKQNTSIIKKSCNAIDSLVDGLEPADIKPYLPQLMSHMVRLFSHPDFKIKGPAISATGSIAACSEQNFAPYFEKTMHELQGYVQMKDSNDELDLRAVTCDAMGSMALAVGAEAFRGYIEPLMQATVEGLNLEHPKLKETSYLFWAMMARVYKADFKRYLKGVINKLFESLQTEESDIELDLGDEVGELAGKEITIGGKKIKVAAMSDDDIIEADEIEDLDTDIAEDDDDDDWDDDLDVVSAVAQEKEIAVEALGDILTHCTQDYQPYVKDTIDTVLPLVHHSYEGVQKAALNTLFRLYAAVWDLQPKVDGKRTWVPGLPLQHTPNEDVRKLGDIVIKAAFVCWEDEEDRAIVTDVNRNLAATLRASGPSLIADKSTLETITKTLGAILTKSHACQKDFGDEEDLGLLEETSEYDWLTIDTALDVVAGLALALGESFSQLWKLFEKPVLKFVSGSEAIERSTSVGVIAECIRGMGPAVTPSTSQFLRLLLHRLSDEDAETKSNAAYGVGMLAEKSTAHAEIVKALPAILGKLEPLLQTQEARCKDNAAGCVARMIMAHESDMPVAQVLPALLEILPLRSDFDENEPVYDCIVKLYSRGNSTLLPLTPRLLPVLAEVLAPEPKDQLPNEETREKIVQLVRYIAGKGPQGRQEVLKYENLAALL